MKEIGKMLTTMVRMMGMKNKGDDEDNYGNNSCDGDR